MLIMEKAKRIFRHIEKETGDDSEKFLASRESGEATNLDVKAAQEFPEQDVQQLLKPHSEMTLKNYQSYALIMNQQLFTSENPNNSITKITEIMDHQFVEQDPDYERSSKARRNILERISCYEEIVHQRKFKKRQLIVDAFITKKPKGKPKASPSSQPLL
ncbi:hypothetical protein T11_9523 [Trichinella zimbabwensis]|uniref:Uncharacterized protein n=1 Tax=Trichinella zimbabwensis TaxID=268475 RepID=A0A0V1I8J5_9BILA|nr:hypothetical protein T11_9523 [Trichinella zimbabwensis]